MDAARARNLNIHPIGDRRGIDVGLVDAILVLLDALDIDVLHTSEFRSNVLGLLCRRKRRISLVSTAHGWIANDARGVVFSVLDRILLRRFDRVILVSSAMRRRLPRWWIPDSRVRVIPNALMVESYGIQRSTNPRRVPDPHADVHLVSVGRLSPEKGQVLLLQAVALLHAEFPGIRLTVAGTGPLEDDLRRLSKDLGIADRVAFPGFVRDMPALYSAADLVVQSSLTEGFPNVILEAAFLEVPIVATDVGGTAEIVQHRATGWLIESNSLEALVAGIRQYLSDPAAFVAMGRSMRSQIVSRYSFESRTEAQTQVYEELAGVPK
jgi:glycosyltransferase involved in cell wall biosynthesis